jgi:hypothetical protein
MSEGGAATGPPRHARPAEQRTLPMNNPNLPETKC